MQPRAKQPRTKARTRTPRPAAADLEARSEEAARLLAEIANPRRLLILCKLAEAGEMSVGELAEAIGLGQSALSQHLARLREDKIVATRREGVAIHYRIADPRIGQILKALQNIFCR